MPATKSVALAAAVKSPRKSIHFEGNSDSINKKFNGAAPKDLALLFAFIYF